MASNTPHPEKKSAPATRPQSTQGKPLRDPHPQEESLKGTFASVMLLGGFLLVTWLLVFFLYLARN